MRAGYARSAEKFHLRSCQRMCCFHATLVRGRAHACNTCIPELEPAEAATVLLGAETAPSQWKGCILSARTSPADQVPNTRYRCMRGTSASLHFSYSKQNCWLSTLSSYSNGLVNDVIQTMSNVSTNGVVSRATIYWPFFIWTWSLLQQLH